MALFNSYVKLPEGTVDTLEFQGLLLFHGQGWTKTIYPMMERLGAVVVYNFPFNHTERFISHQEA